MRTFDFGRDDVEVLSITLISKKDWIGVPIAFTSRFYVSVKVDSRHIGRTQRHHGIILWT